MKRLIVKDPKLQAKLDAISNRTGCLLCLAAWAVAVGLVWLAIRL